MAKIVSDDIKSDLYLLFCTACMRISTFKPDVIIRENIKSYKCSNCGSIILETHHPKIFAVDNPDESKLRILLVHQEVESIPGKQAMDMLSKIKYIDEVLRFAQYGLRE